MGRDARETAVCGSRGGLASAAPLRRIGRARPRPRGAKRRGRASRSREGSASRLRTSPADGVTLDDRAGLTRRTGGAHIAWIAELDARGADGACTRRGAADVLVARPAEGGGLGSAA